MKISNNNKIPAAALALLPAATAFVMPNAGRMTNVPVLSSGPLISPTSLIASTLENPAVVVGEESQDSLVGEAKPRTSLDVRIHGEWYDLKGWRKAHPAGEHWIDWYDGRDATEVMDGFHSDKGRMMVKRLPKSKPEVRDVLEANAVPDSDTQIAFRKLRDELEKDGWWKRDVVHEYKLLGIWGSLVAVGAIVARTNPIVSTLLLGLSMTAAGWLGHDYIHGVDPFASKLRNFAALAAGLLPVWWSDKHNKHHALTNEQGVDEDIATDPFLFQWAPSPENDHPLRKIQHLIFYIPFSFLFALWRIDSVKVAISSVRQKRAGSKPGLYSLIFHYAWLWTLFPVNVWLPAIFMSGLLSALIVTPTHQSEEMFSEYQPDWVTAQFQSTRNAVATNPFSEWLWGGMQYQLEHHLFPSMPRMNYPKLRPILQKFAKENNVPGGYRESGEFEILKMNWDLYRRVAKADPVPGAPSSRGKIGQQGGILDSANSPAAALARSSQTVSP
eukprot:CAMPEP_0172372286 /NCGR_PEP_ID=MMETSP1060-20121228/46834_1 /TAXON_ID=37318 /ORGANISM="Pseudo-nitzschia pungens, Strain cf. cingulata" /LENGTH=499 /DNA_ID=CAMNT_0013098207 /DNA_START=285 /DNA_END=1784 /DNA_ORIENTATION=+